MILIIVLLLALPIWSCSDDDSNPVKPKEPAYKCLEATCPRDNVLHNLQTAYNDRNISRYDELLDADFIFYFSAADFQNGTVSAEYWSWATEINANKNMFDPNYGNPNLQPAEDIDLLLTYTVGDDQWTPIAPEDPVKYAGETWYRRGVTYNIKIVLPGDFELLSGNKQADFVVRAATKDSKQYWQIVVWRDDTGTGFGAGVGAGDFARAITKQSWGQMKERYSE